MVSIRDDKKKLFRKISSANVPLKLSAGPLKIVSIAKLQLIVAENFWIREIQRSIVEIHFINFCVVLAKCFRWNRNATTN